MRVRTAIVILNYNTRNYLEQFIPKVLSSIEGMDARLIVADNASKDGSVELMKEKFPQVELISFEENYGFTGGYNRALKDIDAEFYVLLNSDVEVTQDWLQPLIEWMEFSPTCGACGPKILSYKKRDYFEYGGAAGGYIDSLGYPFCRGRILNRIERDKRQYDTPADVLWCCGACLLIRSKVWEQMGGFDDRFFAHFDELDLCWRMQLRGWGVSNIPQSVVYHIGGGTLSYDSLAKAKLNFRNNLLTMDNNLASTFKAIGKRGKNEESFINMAKRRINIRMCLDGTIAVLSLLTFRPGLYRSIVQAHKEYRAMRRPMTVIEDAYRPDGIRRGWIITKYIFKKI